MVASVRTEPRGSMAMELTFGDPALTARLERGVDAAEERLRAVAAEARDPRVAEIVGHLFAPGGKRLRPLLALVGAEFGERDPSAAVPAAALAELVHVASLYHDDVMDQARTRRGVASANARWGNATAVFAGNWLLSKAARLAAELGPETIRLQSSVTNRLVMGQIRELAGPSDDGDALAHYFAVVAGKTAALIAMALQLGAVRTDAPEHVVQALAEYGEHLGVAFQIADDILDITSTSEVSGKEQGKDLAIGVASLPVLLALADERPEAEELRALLTAATAAPDDSGLPRAAAPDDSGLPRAAAPDGSGLPRAVAPDDSGLPRAATLLRRCGATAQARAIMQARLVRARSAANGLPDGPAARVLHALCDFVAHRDR
ncbi:polyprenyl synthetase family protein [Streptomyces demainii]|uniref:Heptaprenyl diphosphate synthase n=1 Tax=Streptomyces demainii TaxID=588122 RepID=A0ABT9KR56_9ACTN|nr:polyprenyl synthetase family protein [Streptomyces demainii]MDP9609997.1 heptaprenyl diphosphate synthase [Streptomyces demainii]